MSTLVDLTVVVLGLAFAVVAVVAYKKHCNVADLREDLKDADTKIAALIEYIDKLQSAKNKKSK